MTLALVKKLPQLNERLVGIVRTKPGTSLHDTLWAIELAFDSGISAIEITSNSGYWQNVVNFCARKNLNIGVGSVKDNVVALLAIDCGAKFLVSPGLFEDVVQEAGKYNIPYLPGIYTEDELKHVVDLGISDVKFFPANVTTHEELFKSIKEPFRDEFEELNSYGKKIVPYGSTSVHERDIVVESPTQFYKEYLRIQSGLPFNKVVIKLPSGKTGFNRLEEFAASLHKHQINTYAVGGVNETNLKNVIDNYGAYGACVGSSLFDSEAILQGDLEKVQRDIKKYILLLSFKLYAANHFNSK